MITISGYTITVVQILATVFGAGMLVFVHELGHFIAAKRLGLTVEQFAFGFGPEVFGFTYVGTRYSIIAIPLGGMVKMPGGEIEVASGAPGEFFSEPWYKRIAVAVSGPAMNYLLAIIIFAFVAFRWGMSHPTEYAIIGEVVENFPAAQAGIRSGDKIIRIDATTVATWQEMATYIHAHPEAVLTMNIMREGSEIAIPVTPRKDPASGNGLIGVAPQMETETVSLYGSVDFGVRMVVFQSVYTLAYLGTKIMRFERPDVSGPIGVVQFLAKAAKTGWKELLHLLAVISTALGLFNLLPIPILDGGHIFFGLVEGITRRRVSAKIMQTATTVGFSLIIVIFLFATFNDISRIMR